MTDTTHHHIHEFIRLLLSAVASASLYGMNHPQVTRLTTQAFSSACIALGNRNNFSFIIVENDLIIEGQPQEAGLFFERFTQILKGCGIGHMKLQQGLTQAETTAFIGALARQESSSGTIASSEHIRLGYVNIRSADTATTNGTNSVISPQSQQQVIQKLPEKELEQFKEIYENVKHHQQLKINGLLEVVSGFVNVFRQEGRPLLVMAAMRDIDEYTFTHSTNVCILNLAQASALGIEGEQLSEIGMSAMLHDIGKLFIPEEILTKQGKLTDAEFDIMKQHPVKGARYLLETPGVPRLAAITAFEHHMKHNFSGYPAVPGDWRQNLCSQMTMISDFFDALRTKRPYREPMPLQEIAGIMLGMMGKELHPVLTRNFLRIISHVMKNESP